MLSGDRVVKGVLEVSLSDELRLVLKVEGRSPLKVDLPEKLLASDAWRAHRDGPPVTTALADGRARWEQAFVLEPLQKGRQDVQPRPLRFRESDGAPQEATWKPFPVLVITQVLKPDVGAIHDITPIEELPPPPTWPGWLPAAAAGLLGGGLLLALWLRRRRRLLQALPLPPDRAALRELERIAGLDLSTPGDVERYHTLLADVVRRFLERRWQLPARRQTTTEFLESVRRAPQLTAGQQELLRDFLGRCDLAKFAPVTPPPEECLTTAALARRLIEDGKV